MSPAGAIDMAVRNRMHARPVTKTSQKLLIRLDRRQQIASHRVYNFPRGHRGPGPTCQSGLGPTYRAI